MGALDAGELAALASPELREIDCPELKGSVYIRRPRLSQSIGILDAITEAGGEDADTQATLKLQRELLVMCVCDAEGNTVWDETQADTFQAKHSDSAMVIFDGIVAFLGVPDEGKASPDL